MLDLTSSSRALDMFHRRFQDDTLPEELSSEVFSRFDRGAYDATTLGWALSAWQARALDEYRSQVAFTDLLQDMTRLGCSFDLLGTAIRVVRDEARHVELCRRMISILGGSDVVPGQPAFINPSAELPPMSRVLRTLIGFLCIGETLSVRLISAVRDNTRDDLAKAVMTRLAADESIHARFGWVALELLTPFFSPEQRAEIDELLPFYFGAVEDAVIASARDRSDQHGPTNPFGYLSYEERMERYEDSLRRDILPRFESLGYEAKRAHENRTLTLPSVAL
jgi:hypothetical protein